MRIEHPAAMLGMVGQCIVFARLAFLGSIREERERGASSVIFLGHSLLVQVDSEMIQHGVRSDFGFNCRVSDRAMDTLHGRSGRKLIKNHVGQNIGWQIDSYLQ